jgi:glutaredoxin
MITVYGRENCPGCHYTCKFLDTNNVDYTYIDVDTGDIPDDMPAQLPYVVAPPHTPWSGYRRDRLRALAVIYGKP